MTKKSWLAGLSLLALAISSQADEIKFTGAKWDNLANALSIRPFYLEVKSDTLARKVKLLFEVYQGGKLAKQYTSVGVARQEAASIDLKSALFFAPKDDASEYAITWTLDLGDNVGTSRFLVPKSLVDLSSTGMTQIPPTVAASARSLVAVILCNSKEGYAMSDDFEAMLAANKSATVIGIFLERE